MNDVALQLNCGTGAGGFHDGNTCAKGGAGRAVADSPQERSRAAVQKVLDRSLKKAEDDGIPAERVKGYREAFSKATEAMSDGAYARLAENAKAIRFYGTGDELTAEANRRAGSDASGMVGGFWYWRDGTPGGELHLDGGYESGDFIDSAADIYTHELSHAIDGHQELSRDSDWQKAWDTEIAGLKADPPSFYATTSAAEGFAEFGRLVLTDPTAARRYPGCYAFWKSKRLV
jgi:hypothetical protein